MTFLSNIRQKFVSKSYHYNYTYWCTGHILAGIVAPTLELSLKNKLHNAPSIHVNESLRIQGIYLEIFITLQDPYTENLLDEDNAKQEVPEAQNPLHEFKVEFAVETLVLVFAATTSTKKMGRVLLYMAKKPGKLPFFMRKALGVTFLVTTTVLYLSDRLIIYFVRKLHKTQEKVDATRTMRQLRRAVTLQFTKKGCTLKNQCVWPSTKTETALGVENQALAASSNPHENRDLETFRDSEIDETLPVERPTTLLKRLSGAFSGKKEQDVENTERSSLAFSQEQCLAPNYRLPSPGNVPSDNWGKGISAGSLFEGPEVVENLHAYLLPILCLYFIGFLIKVLVYHSFSKCESMLKFREEQQVNFYAAYKKITKMRIFLLRISLAIDFLATFSLAGFYLFFQKLVSVFL